MFVSLVGWNGGRKGCCWRCGSATESVDKRLALCTLDLSLEAQHTVGSSAEVPGRKAETSSSLLRRIDGSEFHPLCLARPALRTCLGMPFGGRRQAGRCETFSGLDIIEEEGTSVRVLKQKEQKKKGSNRLPAACHRSRAWQLVPRGQLV